MRAVAISAPLAGTLVHAGRPGATEADDEDVKARAAFDEVLAAHGPGLWRLTAGYAIERADREDLYQQILLAVWRALPRFRGDASIRTFVYRIGHNRGLTYRARSVVRVGREAEMDEELPDPRPPADEQLEREVERERLARAIAGLSPTLAQPVLLHLEGFSHAEIAEVLGITENNVGVRMNRARAALAQRLSRGESP